MKRALTEAIVVTAIAAGAVLAAFYTGRAEAQALGAQLSQSLERVQLGFGDEVGGVSEFRTAEHSEVPTLTVSLDVSAPPSSVFGNPQDSSLAIGSGLAEVLHVFSFRRRTQVIPSVVDADGVFVVDLVWRPLPGHVEPRQTVGSVRPVIDHNFNVAIAGYGAGCLTYLVTGSSYEPSEQAGDRVVMQQFPKAFCGDNWSSHDATPVRFGKKPASVESAVRASPSYGINLVTAHSSGGYRTFTPGIYARSESGITAGVLRNSEGSWGAHAGKTWHTQVMGLPIDLQAGAITGYRRAPVLPLVTASVLLGEHHRIIAIPGPGCLAVHYALEWK